MTESIQPTIITIPSNTTSFYITALSLLPQPSRVSVTWTQGSATFGATFIGPSPDCIMFEKVFGAPIIVNEGGEMPRELSVEFEYGPEEDASITEKEEGQSTAEKTGGDSSGRAGGRWKVDDPVMLSCGPAGSSKKVLVKGYSIDDVGLSQPITVTIMFKGVMRGLRRE